tara:strand:+ start:29870 stop:30076 length:207 start_codon:yes stop_codon:yes gene_type:complete
MLPIFSYCVTIRPEVEKEDQLIPTPPSKEKAMSKVLNRVRPVVEAAIISVLLAVAALAIPAAIVYTAV